MAYFDQEFALAALPQVADGTYNATLDAITTTLDDGDGLLLGAQGEGVADSGIDFTIEREEIEKAALPGSFTKPIGKLVRRVGTVSFSVPFGGNREDTTADTTVDGDFTPTPGLDALLGAVGLAGAAWSGGTGWRYAFGSLTKCSLLIYANGLRYKCLDCVANLSLDLTPGQIATATFEISIGSFEAVEESALPTLDFGVQATVPLPIVENAGNDWGETRGWSELTLSIENQIEQFGDSNAPGGIRVERAGRTTTLEGVLYCDDGDKDFEWSQLGADDSGSLTPWTFKVGDAADPETPAVAFSLSAPQPVAKSFAPVATGDKAAAAVTVELHHSSANSELEIIFI